jgi:hypothetical protein
MSGAGKLRIVYVAGVEPGFGYTITGWPPAMLSWSSPPGHHTDITDGQIKELVATSAYDLTDASCTGSEADHLNRWTLRRYGVTPSP